MKYSFLAIAMIVVLAGCTPQNDVTPTVSEVSKPSDNINNIPPAEPIELSDEDAYRLPPLKPLLGNDNPIVESPSWKTYTDDEYGFSFRYPEDSFPYMGKGESEGGKYTRIITLSDGKIGGQEFDVFTSDESLEQCVQYRKNQVDEVNEDRPNLNGRDSIFVEDLVNGNNVVFHKQNFDSMIGNVFNMYIQTFNGTCLTFSSESSHDLLEAVYRSVTITD